MKYLLSILFLTICYIQGFSQIDSVTYRIEAAGAAATEGYLPLWIVANRYGVLEEDGADGYLRVGAAIPFQQDKKFFILGEMREMGKYAAEEHLHIIKAVKATGLNGIFIGNEFLNCSPGFEYKFFETTAAAITYLNTLDLNGYTILIKGSRGIKLEDVTTVL